MALSVKPYFFPERWMVMGERSTLTAGQKSRLGEESRDEGLEEKECGDIGLASGEKPPCCSTEKKCNVTGVNQRWYKSIYVLHFTEGMDTRVTRNTLVKVKVLI